VLTASRRLAERNIPHTVVYLFEPGWFRTPRGAAEGAHQAPAAVQETLFPATVPRRLFVSHTRPEAILGLLGALHTGAHTSALGYLNQGGTLNTPGMLYVNRCSWAHCLAEVARLLDLPRTHLLSAPEVQALDGAISPHGVIIPEVAA
jgi:phosphoketolase